MKTNANTNTNICGTNTNKCAAGCKGEKWSKPQTQTYLQQTQTSVLLVVKGESERRTQTQTLYICGTNTNKCETHCWLLRGKWWKETNTTPGERTASGSDCEGAKRAAWGRNGAKSGKSETKCVHGIVVRVWVCFADLSTISLARENIKLMKM